MKTEIFHRKYGEHTLIKSEVYRLTEPNKEPVYKTKVASIRHFINERDDNGHETGILRTVWLDFEDILRLADRINELKNTPGDASDYQDDDLPF